MKHIPLIFITIILTCHFAQSQNDMRARLEYEDAEVAFQKKEYRKTLEHLDNADKLLGMWTAKTGYLKTLALDHIIDYGAEWNDNVTELSRNVEKYMTYANENPDKVDFDKVREIYAIEKRIDFAKKKKDFESDPDYIAGNEAYNSKNYNLAMTHYLNVAKKNNTRAMDKISDMYRDGVGFEVDYQKSLEWDTKASELGDPICTADIGFMYLRGYGVTTDYKKALEYFHIAANYGLGYAMSEIGYMHSSGYGVTTNYQEAFNWYSKAVDKGNSRGMFYIGNAYYSGQGVKQNYLEAINWFQKIADKGDHISKIAMTYIGDMYFNKIGVVQSYQTALDWYTKALEREISLSLLLKIGACNLNLKNYSQSMEWYAKAYETAYELKSFDEMHISKEQIARMYDEGLGVEKDKRKAKEWRNK